MIVRLAAISGAVFMDAVRRRIIYVVGFFGLVLAFLIPTLPSYGVGVVIGLYREVALALTFVASVVLVLALASNRIPSEVERRTVYNVLAKPVHRLEYVVGTWLGIMAVMAAAISAFTAIEQIVGLLQYQDPVWRLWEGSLAIWFETGAVAAFAIAVSTVAGPVVVSVASLTMVFIGHSRDSVVQGGPPVLRALYPSLDTFNVIDPVAHGAGIGLLDGLGMVLAFVGWAGVMLLVGVLAFSRRDL